MDTKTCISNEAFDRFRAFAKKVVNVPKAVIDKREKEYQKRREGRKTGKTPEAPA